MTAWALAVGEHQLVDAMAVMKAHQPVVGGGQCSVGERFDDPGHVFHRPFQPISGPQDSKTSRSRSPGTDQRSGLNRVALLRLAQN